MASNILEAEERDQQSLKKENSFRHERTQGIEFFLKTALENKQITSGVTGLQREVNNEHYGYVTGGKRTF